jgi:hypothetical protein
MMLAGLPTDAVHELAGLVRYVGADDLADRLDRAVADDVKLLALTLALRAQTRPWEILTKVQYHA